jgi:hypothetical protein
MEAVFGVATAVLATASIVSTLKHDNTLSKLQNCADELVLSQHEYSNERQFVKCMKNNFPYRFAEAYHKKALSDSIISKEDTTSEYQ